MLENLEERITKSSKEKPYISDDEIYKEKEKKIKLEMMEIVIIFKKV